MSKTKRPERKRIESFTNPLIHKEAQQLCNIYNSACQDWEEFLPGVEEIELIIYDTIVSLDMKAIADGLPSGETNFLAIAQAIYKRLKREG